MGLHIVLRAVLHGGLSHILRWLLPLLLLLAHNHNHRGVRHSSNH